MVSVSLVGVCTQIFTMSKTYSGTNIMFFIGNQICFSAFWGDLGVLRSGKVGKGLKDVKGL